MPCFDELKETRRTCAVVYYAFDLLRLDGEDLPELPLLKRKAALKRMPRKTRNNRIRFMDHVIGEGLALFALEDRELEGMVAKRVDSRYVGCKLFVFGSPKRSELEPNDFLTSPDGIPSRASL